MLVPPITHWCPGTCLFQLCTSPYVMCLQAVIAPPWGQKYYMVNAINISTFIVAPCVLDILVI